MGGLGGMLSGLAGLANVFLQWQQLEDSKKIADFNMKNATVQSHNIAIQQQNREARKKNIQNSLNGTGVDPSNDGHKNLETL